MKPNFIRFLIALIAVFIVTSNVYSEVINVGVCDTCEYASINEAYQANKQNTVEIQLQPGIYEENLFFDYIVNSAIAVSIRGATDGNGVLLSKILGSISNANGVGTFLDELDIQASGSDYAIFSEGSIFVADSIVHNSKIGAKLEYLTSGVGRSVAGFVFDNVIFNNNEIGIHHYSLTGNNDLIIEGKTTFRDNIQGVVIDKAGVKNKVARIKIESALFEDNKVGIFFKKAQLKKTKILKTKFKKNKVAIKSIKSTNYESNNLKFINNTNNYLIR